MKKNSTLKFFSLRPFSFQLGEISCRGTSMFLTRKLTCDAKLLAVLEELCGQEST